MVSLGERVKELREKSGLSQGDFQKKHGFGVNKIEAGERGKKVRYETLVALADAFGITTDALTAGTDQSADSIAAQRVEKFERAAELAHKNPQVDAILAEYGDRLSYQQGKDLLATAAAKGTTVDEVREIAKQMIQKTEKREPTRSASPPAKRPKSTQRAK